MELRSGRRIAALTAILAVGTAPEISTAAAFPQHVPSKEPNIYVAKPKRNQEVGMPIKVMGKARVFENTVNFRVTDKKHHILAEDFTTADASDIGEYGQFSASVQSIAKPKSKEGYVSVFNYSAKDGSVENRVTRKVKFDLDNARDLKLYFVKKSSSSTRCDLAVASVTHLSAPTRTPGRQALRELLKGPAPVEGKRGYATAINYGTELKSLIIDKKGVAHADFTTLLAEGVAGSCRVQAIEAQITKTLEQFPTVKDVEITVNGKEDALQP